VHTSAPFADLRTGTPVNGLPRPILGGDTLTDAGAAPGERRVRLHSNYGTMVDEYGYDGVWHGTKRLLIAQPTQTGVGSLPSGVTATIAQVAVPDPGYPYHIVSGGLVDFGASNGSTSAPAALQCSINVGSAVLNTNALTRAQASSVSASLGTDYNCVVPVNTSSNITPGGYTGS